MKSKTSIGDKIRILRNMRNYSQKGLAWAAGLSQEKISYIETNKMKSIETSQSFSKIAKALGLTPEEIKQWDPSKITLNHFQDTAKQEIFIQNLTLSNREEVIRLQTEVIDSLRKLNDYYKAQL